MSPEEKHWRRSSWSWWASWRQGRPQERGFARLFHEKHRVDIGGSRQSRRSQKKSRERSSQLTECTPHQRRAHQSLFTLVTGNYQRRSPATRQRRKPLDQPTIRRTLPGRTHFELVNPASEACGKATTRYRAARLSKTMFMLGVAGLEVSTKG